LARIGPASSASDRLGRLGNLVISVAGRMVRVPVDPGDTDGVVSLSDDLRNPV